MRVQSAGSFFQTKMELDASTVAFIEFVYGSYIWHELSVQYTIGFDLGPALRNQQQHMEGPGRST